MERRELVPGDVVQLAPDYVAEAFGGCFMLVTERRDWGAIGFVAVPETPSPGAAYFRASWNQMEFIGRAAFQPKGDNDDE